MKSDIRPDLSSDRSQSQTAPAGVLPERLRQVTRFTLICWVACVRTDPNRFGAQTSHICLEIRMRLFARLGNWIRSQGWRQKMD